MARTLIMATWEATIALTAGEFFMLGGTALQPTGAAEARHQIRAGLDGHVCFLGAQVPDLANGQKLRFRKGGSNGTQLLTLASGFASTPDQDTIAVDDLFNIAVESGAGSTGVATVRMLFSADSGHGTLYASWIDELPVINTTTYFPLAGAVFTGGALAEVKVQTKFSVPGTLHHLQVYIESNPSGADSFIKLNVNGVTQISKTVPAGGTGLFINTSDTAAVVDGSLVSLQFDAGAGIGNMGIVSASAWFTATSGSASDVFGTTHLRTSSFTGTVYLPISGYGVGAIESHAVVQVGFPATASRLAFYVEQNTMAVDCPVTLRINGVDGTVTKTVPAGAANQWFEATLPSDSLLASDNVCLSVTNSGPAGILGITTTRLRITDNGGGDACNGPVPPDVVYGVPGLIGCAYTSRAQLLRPDYGNDAGAQAGPAFGKKRRLHQYGAYMFRTRDITFGTDFAALRQHQASLTTTEDAAPETAIGGTDLFTGITSQSIADDYSWTGQIAWVQARPTPGTILAIAGYLDTSEK